MIRKMRIDVGQHCDVDDVNEMKGVNIRCQLDADQHCSVDDVDDVKQERRGTM